MARPTTPSLCCAKSRLSTAGSPWSSCAATLARPPASPLALIMPAGSTSSPWTAICSTIPTTSRLFLEKIAAGYDIVSGWRKVRVDNFWMRRIPSRIANWMMAKISGVDIHDFGTTFKAYRRDILEQVPLYGELHRFIPALASWHGATICEVPIRNVNRERGVSHYGITRTFRVFFDLLTIRFLLRYLSRPLHFFGSVGMMSIFGGSAIVLWLGLEKFLRHVPVMAEHGPLMMTALGLSARWSESSGDRPAGRNASAPLSRAQSPRSILRRPSPACAKRRAQRLRLALQ